MKALPTNCSGWRGGIGIAFSAPAARMADITELGVDICWGSQTQRQDHRWGPMAGAAQYYYFGCTVQLSLKDRDGRFDFSDWPDKDAAARAAVDAWLAVTFGAKGLSGYVKSAYRPNSYGDVEGTYDLSAVNDLARTIVRQYLARFEDGGIRYGGVALDNAGRIPEPFLRYLSDCLHEKGFGVAANGCPESLANRLDLFCDEKFPYSVAFARSLRAYDFTGVFGEFPIRHLSAGELDRYLKTKLFNGIVFFGYTDDPYGCDAAKVSYSFYHSRPDVYNHHRWVLRRLVPLSRSLVKAGRQAVALARTASGATQLDDGIRHVAVNDLGIVREGSDLSDAEADIFKGSLALDNSVEQFGADPAAGIFLVVNAQAPETVHCDRRALGITPETLACDEFKCAALPLKLTDESARFTAPAGTSVIQLGTRATIIRNLLGRIEAEFAAQQLQRRMDAALGCRYPRKLSAFPDDVWLENTEPGLGSPLKYWEPFCQGYLIDTKESLSGGASLRLEGGSFAMFPGSPVRHHHRQGAAQLVNVNQVRPAPLVLTAHSKAFRIPRSDLSRIENRRFHFAERLGHYYCMHLYLDYQDGAWPEIHTAAFSPGTHDWESRVLRVVPEKPVKTAMVLLELHQPEGTAWWDDVSLVPESDPQDNLLACPGFEAEDSNGVRAHAAAYDRLLDDLLQRMTQAQRAMTPDALRSLRQQVRELEAWVSVRGLARYLPREMRDLEETRRLLDIAEAL